MRFCKVQGALKIVRQIFENSFQNRLKIHSKSLPEALQNDPQKTHAKKTPKNRKKYRKWSPTGGSQGGPRMWFSDMEAPLGAPGGHNGSQTSPQGTPDPSEPSFLMIFGLILGRFFYDFGLLFVSMFCRIVLAFSLHFWHALR